MYKKLIDINGKISASAVNGVLRSKNGRIVIDLDNETITVDGCEIKAMTYTTSTGETIKYWGWE